MEWEASSTLSQSPPLHHHHQHHHHQQQAVKRRFSAMTDNRFSDARFTPLDDLFDDEQPPQRPRLMTTLALPPRRHRRYAGDGYDYRRPANAAERGPRDRASSRGRATVIDLTGEEDSPDNRNQTHLALDQEQTATSSRAQRLPRFERDIIEVEEPEERISRSEEHTEQEPNANDASPSYDIDDLFPDYDNHRLPPLLSAHRRPQTRQPSDNDMDDLEILEEHTVHPRPYTSSTNTSSTFGRPAVSNDPIDLTMEDDEVVHISSRVRPRVDLGGPVLTAGVRMRELDEIPTGFGALIGGAIAPPEVAANHVHHQHRHLGTYHAHHVHHHPGPRVRVAVDLLGYDAVGFDMGIIGGNQPPAPKYEPPEAAKAGFTRSPQEDEKVVCSNCGEELAMGDTEEKQQVWVIKKCGHAYCGLCANNRAKGLRSKKGKGKAPASQELLPPPFAKCVVHGCKESASSKAMVHVFLGS